MPTVKDIVKEWFRNHPEYDGLYSTSCDCDCIFIEGVETDSCCADDCVAGVFLGGKHEPKEFCPGGDDCMCIGESKTKQGEDK